MKNRDFWAKVHETDRVELIGALSLEIPADLETPVSAFLKLRPLGARILLESVERGERVGRYSVIGVGTISRIVADENVCRVTDGEKTAVIPMNGERGPLEILRSFLSRFSLADVEYKVPFLMSAIGYISYDIVRYFETLPATARSYLSFPLLHLEIPRSLVVFDHVKRKAILATLFKKDGHGEESRAKAIDRLVSLSGAFHSPLPGDVNRGNGGNVEQPVSNFTREAFEEIVRRGKEYIVAGDVFQVVLSQRLEGKTGAKPIQIYRALRMLNPSPYMFYLNFGDYKLIGSSPEALVRLEDGVAIVRPIAGTRPRGHTEDEDQALADELVSDEKEKAEHIMLVDLARNDLGRVSRYGSVEVTELMKVEYYSHVMHMVSRVEGKLREDVDMFDLLRATFPAGTVTGAPKIRAMEIIEELEGTRRGPYAGCVGYFGPDGDMDMCITIRTILLESGKYYIQAGAGVVYDSDPEREYYESLSKLKALGKAIEIAEGGFE